MVYLLDFWTQIFVFLSQGVVAFDENGNRKCKVFIRQFRKSSKLILKTSAYVYRWKHSPEKENDSYLSSPGSSL